MSLPIVNKASIGPSLAFANGDGTGDEIDVVAAGKIRKGLLQLTFFIIVVICKLFRVEARIPHFR